MSEQQRNEQVKGEDEQNNVEDKQDKNNTKILGKIFIQKEWHTPLSEIAECVKIALQIGIALGIIYLIGLRFLLLFERPPCSPPKDQWQEVLCAPLDWEIGDKPFREASVLAIVSNALAYAAAIELAYMLFTPGPDEAVTPLILGLASLVLSVAASTNNFIESSPGRLLNASMSIGIIVVGIGILFYLRSRFLPPDEKGGQMKSTIQRKEPVSIKVQEVKAHITSDHRYRVEWPSIFRRNRQ